MVENRDYAMALKRMIESLGKRCAAGDNYDLKYLQYLDESLGDAKAAAVAGLRQQGHSWSYIAQGLGCTKQYAHSKWGKTK